MKLPNFIQPRDWSAIRGIIERADKQNLKRGQDLEVGGGRLILTSPNGTRYEVTVDNAGTLTTSAL